MKDEVNAGERSRQSLTGATLLGHGIAVKGGCYRPGFARNVEQDGGDGAAKQSAPVNAGQHDDGRGWRHREGQRQQDGHTISAAQPGQHTDQHAQHNADDHQQHVHGGQNNCKPLK